MTRNLAFVTALAALLAAAPVAAQPAADRVVSQLAAQGYDEIEVGRTLLNRIRIVAESADEWREIIVDPRTGEILRDLWRMKSGATGAGDARLIRSDDDDDPEDDADGDDDDDDDEDDDDDDNSGPGGGSDDDDKSGDD